MKNRSIDAATDLKCDRRPEAYEKLAEAIKTHGSDIRVKEINATSDGIIINLLFGDGHEHDICDFGKDIFIYERVRKDNKFDEKRVFIIFDEPKIGNITILIN